MTELHDSLAFWRDHLLCLSLHPHPIWQLTGQQLHAFWLLPDESWPLPPPSLSFTSLFDMAAVIYIDASKFGFGFVRQTSQDSEPNVIVRAPDCVNQWEEQVHSEAAAYLHAAEFAVRTAQGRTTRDTGELDCH